jgi:hypothetical protein
LDAGLKAPPDGADSDLIFRGKLLHGLAFGVALSHHAPLALVERRRSAELRALALGALDALLAALADQFWKNSALLDTARCCVNA